MNAFFQEIASILTTPPGNLTYHLVLAFSVAGAFQGAINAWRSSRSPQAKRMLLGLGFLLVLRLVLFALAGFSWQGLINEHIDLPPIDRGVTLLSIITIVWLWVFPDRNKPGDAASLLLGLGALAGAALSWVWWSEQGNTLQYNGSWPDFLDGVAALAILALGGLIILLRRPVGWGIGLGMLGLAACGHALYLLLPTPTGDFPSLVRLAQMAAYPLLLALPHRVPALQPAANPPKTQASQERRRYGTDPRLLEDFMLLNAEIEPEKVCQTITRSFAFTMLADICLLLFPPNADKEIPIQCGYDLIREVHLFGSRIPYDRVPLIAAAIERGLPLRLQASSTSSDLQNLARQLNLEQCGHLLVVPAVAEDGAPLCSVILLSPYSKRPWNAEDQAMLTNLTGPLAQLLQRDRLVAALQRELEQSNQALQAVEKQLESIGGENESLRAQFQTISEQIDQNRSKAESLAAFIAARDQTQESSADLQANSEPSQQPSSGQGALLKPATESVAGEGELRLALEEVARLNSLIAELQQKATSADTQPGESLPGEVGSKLEEITDIVHELRQPMSSIIGYTDFLLSETIGILGAMQRKFLERVQMSTERMGRLVDDLARIADVQVEDTGAPSDGVVSLEQVAQDAVAQVKPLIQEKEINLHLELSPEIPELALDRRILGQVISNLLENASEVTQQGGEITLRGRVEGTEQQERYALVQIADQGGGIPSEFIPRLFSRYTGLNGKSIPGVAGQGAILSVTKALVDNLGGRIWVDSELSVGSTYSLLLPVASNKEAGDTNPGEETA